jgi:cell division protein FtsW
MNIFSRTNTSLIARWWWTVDRVMLTLFIVLLIFGVVLVTTAGPPVAERVGLDMNYFTSKHLVFLIPTLLVMIGASMLDLKQIWRIALIMLAGSVVLLIAVLIFGEETKGAHRWLRLFGFSLQPSEFAKPAFIVVAAWLIARQKEKPGFQGFYFAIGLYGMLITLLMLQPDMGMSFVVSFCFFAVIFLAGIPFRWIILLGVFAIGGLFAAYFGFHHVQSRIDRFLNPESGDTYQIDRSIAAFQNGGLFGTGAGQGEVKLTIPDAHADFIFAVAAEELGMFVVIFLVILYAYVLVRGYNRIMDTDNIFVILASGGLLTMFGLQAFVNMGSTIHLLPTKGMTLPFISYGGSSLLSMGIAMGMLLGLTRRQGRSGIARGGLSIRPIGGNISGS